MNDVEPYYIPRYLDEPERWMFFTFDEAGALIGPIAIGYLSGEFLLGLLLGIAALYGLRKLKGGEGLNVAINAVYWYMPQGLSGMKGTAPSHIRRYVG